MDTGWHRIKKLSTCLSTLFFQTYPVVISWHFDQYNVNYNSLSDATFTCCKKMGENKFIKKKRERERDYMIVYDFIAKQPYRFSIMTLDMIVRALQLKLHLWEVKLLLVFQKIYKKSNLNKIAKAVDTSPLDWPYNYLTSTSELSYCTSIILYSVFIQTLTITGSTLYHLPKLFEWYL